MGASRGALKTHLLICSDAFVLCEDIRLGADRRNEISVLDHFVFVACHCVNVLWTHKTLRSNLLFGNNALVMTHNELHRGKNKQFAHNIFRQYTLTDGSIFGARHKWLHELL